MEDGKTKKMTMDYKGYTADVEWDKESGHITGSIPKIKHTPEITAKTLPEVSKEFQRVVDDHIAQTTGSFKRADITQKPAPQDKSGK